MLYSSTALCGYARMTRAGGRYPSFGGVLVRRQRLLAVRDELAERVHRHRLGPLEREAERYTSFN